jgi:hypothetical protein
MVSFSTLDGHVTRQHKEVFMRPAGLINPLSTEAMSLYKEVSYCYLDVTGQEELYERVSPLEVDTEGVTGSTCRLPIQTLLQTLATSSVSSKPFSTERTSERRRQRRGVCIVLNWFRGGRQMGVTWK